MVDNISLVLPLQNNQNFLWLLRFDHKGAGACLKKYSDPSHFRREWCASELGKTENSQREKKVQKAKVFVYFYFVAQKKLFQVLGVHFL